MYRIYLLRSEAYRLDNFDLEVHFDVTFLYLATYSYVNAIEYTLFISEILHLDIIKIKYEFTIVFLLARKHVA